MIPLALVQLPEMACKVSLRGCPHQWVLCSCSAALQKASITLLAHAKTFSRWPGELALLSSSMGHTDTCKSRLENAECADGFIWVRVCGGVRTRKAVPVWFSNPGTVQAVMFIPESAHPGN